MTTHRGIVLVIATCSALSLATIGAFAHPRLVSATPAVGGTVPAAPDTVALRFNERLESKFSSVTIRDSDGKQVDKGDPQLDKSDRRILRVSLPSLAAGVYKVEWQAVGTDGHRIEGDFTFRVDH